MFFVKSCEKASTIRRDLEMWENKKKKEMVEYIGEI